MFTLAIADGVARIAIDRPDARNAVPSSGWHLLRELAGEVAAAAPNVLLIRSADPAIFSAGADLDELAALADDPAARAPFRQALQAALDAIRDLAIPSIAIVEGGAFGAGVALAMACDLRVAGPAARFRIPPARWGILYPGEDIERLTGLVGRGQAVRLLATADMIDSAEAARIGLVEIVADDAGVVAEAIATRIAGNDAASVRALVALARGGPEDPARFDAAFDGPAFRQRIATRP